MNKELGDTSILPRTSLLASHKKATNLPIHLDLPDRIHALAANESEDFIILNNQVNPFVGSDDLFDDSSVDTDNVIVETVDDDDSSFDSEDDSSDNKSENPRVSDRRPSKEGVNKTDKQESEKQQGHLNLRGTRGMRGNLPPPRASHRSGLRQPRHVNYTHTTVNHTNNNSKTRTTLDSHSNRDSKKQSTPKPKYEYLHDTDVVTNNSKNRTTSSKKKTRKHKSRN